MKNCFKRSCYSTLLLIPLSLTESSLAAGVFRDGYNAETAGRAGVSVVGSNTLLGSMSNNPASMGKLRQLGVEVNISVGSFNADFTDKESESHRSRISEGGLPAFAVAWRPEKTPRLTLGLAVTPDIALQTKYDYTDPAGGLAGVSYGRQRHSTLFAAISANLNASYRVTDRLHVGASAGLIYNRNELRAPYIFQDQAPGILPGFKALLDLQVQGIGYNTKIGFLYQLTDSVELGFSHRPKSVIHSDGYTRGNARAQLDQLGVANFNPELGFETAIDTRIPEVNTLGIAWQVDERTKLLFQGQWIENASAWDRLNIELSEGINADLNGLLGADGFTESTPLDWKDQFVFSLAASFPLGKELNGNLGISHTSSPVPADRLTPLTAAVSERVLAAGISGIPAGGARLDLSYQYVADKNVRIDNSRLLGGEYSNTRFSLGGHWLNLSLSW